MTDNNTINEPERASQLPPNSISAQEETMTTAHATTRHAMGFVSDMRSVVSVFRMQLHFDIRRCIPFRAFYFDLNS